jgi:hypothetical protein
MTASSAESATTRTLFPDPSEMLRPTAELIHAFVQRVPNAGRTQIVKLLYLADLEARRCLGHPLTPLNYIWYDHGPFDTDIYVQLDRLCGLGFLHEETYQRSDGKTCYRYSTTDAPPPGEPLKAAELALVNYVAARHGKKRLKALLDEVYQTPPMEQARKVGHRGVTLNMDLVNNASRIPGAELERVLRSIDQVERGQGRSLQEIRAERLQ